MNTLKALGEIMRLVLNMRNCKSEKGKIIQVKTIKLLTKSKLDEESANER